MPITKKQKRVLDFVIQHQQRNGCAPSLEDVARKFNLSSLSTAHYHINKLREQGLLNQPTEPMLLQAPAKIKPSKSTVTDIKKLIDQVFEGDCLGILPRLPDKSVDMILCDLPYGTTQNHWDSIIPLNELWQQYERVIKDNGVIVLTGHGMFTAKLMLSNPSLFKYKITWVKSKPTNFLNAKKQPLRKHEDICIFYKRQPDYNPQMSVGEPYNKGFRKDQLTGSYGDFRTVEVKSSGERYPTDVVYFKTAESEGQVYHPTQKPVELGRYLIKTFTKPGDVVLDNAAGSGSFLVSAILEGRRFIGIEKNKEVFLHRKHRVDYIKVCEYRIKKAKAQLETAELNTGEQPFLSFEFSI